MKIGTKSVLYGAHCFLIHPWFAAFAWWKLYGFRDVADPYLGTVSLRDWRLWLAFIVHDLGYWGCPNMDGPEGELHPTWGADVMHRFGAAWFNFCFFHSRFLAKRHGRPYSMLCVADKLAVSFEPAWLYLPRAIASGEILEYMRDGEKGADGEGKYRGEPHAAKYRNRRDWFRRTTQYMREWAYEHRDGRQDVWTPGSKAALYETQRDGSTGVPV